MKTTFKITSSIKYMEMEILKVSGLTLTAFHRKAIDYFLRGEQRIDPVLKITKRTSPEFVHKDVPEQIYLDSERKEKLQEIADREKCGITIVLFQAVYDYCLYCSSILSNDVIDNIIGN